MQIIKYNLIEINSNTIIQSWNGSFDNGNFTNTFPDRIDLPNGLIVHCPMINTDYDGYMIVEEIEEAKPYVPSSVPLWAVRAILSQNNLLNQANIIIENSNNDTLKIIWEYGNYVDRNSPALLSLAGELNISNQQLDRMFIDANQLVI